METILTNSTIILILQIILLVGFLFLSGLTFVSYKKLKSRLLLFVALGFLTIGLSCLFEFFIVEIEIISGIEEDVLEILFEGLQFVAAFFFFYGLKFIKTKEGK